MKSLISPSFHLSVTEELRGRQAARSKKNFESMTKMINDLVFNKLRSSMRWSDNELGLQVVSLLDNNKAPIPLLSMLPRENSKAPNDNGGLSRTFRILMRAT